MLAPRTLPRCPPGALAFAAGSALLACGCGRRATEADCQLIVNKSVEVQLKQMSETDAPSVKKREEEVRAALGGELASCVGRHVTDEAIACVKAAENPGDLDKCLR